MIEKYQNLNFPFLYRKTQIHEDMLDEKMLKYAKERGRKFPYETNTLTWSGDDQLLTTTLIQFYHELGMQIRKIHWAIKYHRDQPFKGFVLYINTIF